MKHGWHQKLEVNGFPQERGGLETLSRDTCFKRDRGTAWYVDRNVEVLKVCASRLCLMEREGQVKWGEGGISGAASLFGSGGCSSHGGPTSGQLICEPQGRQDSLTQTFTVKQEARRQPKDRVRVEM